MSFSLKEKADCAKREVKHRRWVYANRVREGRMLQKDADYEIALMLEIAGDYERQMENGKQKDLPL